LPQPGRPERRRPPDRRRRQRRRGGTAARVLIALPWIAVAIGVVFYGSTTAFAVLVLGLGVVALHELYRLLAPVNPIPLAGFAGFGALLAAATFGDQFQMVLVSAGAVLLTGALALAQPRRHVTLAIAGTLLGTFWIGLGLAHAVLLRDLDHGDSLLFDVLLATFIGDTAAYFGGRLWGTRQLAPRVSPGKTVEGLLSGFLAGTLAFWFAGLYQDWLSGLDALLIGACVAATAPLGDLFESMIKRDLEVKDSGGFFGEHGGVLDRLDAALFTVVVGYYVANALL
jgi:phosphatidate cytidylyltransferase